MTTYSKFAPTGFDRAGAFLPERQEWIVAPCSVNRDSCALERANWAAMLKILGDESETLEVHRFGHWANGWFEIALLSPERAGEVEEMARGLDNYPVLDDEELSRIESDDEGEGWDAYGRSDFCRALCEHLATDETEWRNEHPDVDALTAEQTDELWRRASAVSGRYVEHSSEGAWFPIAEVVATITLADVQGARQWKAQGAAQ